VRASVILDPLVGWRVSSAYVAADGCSRLGMIMKDAESDCNSLLWQSNLTFARNEEFA
jgi:hypothetical protein